MHVAVIISAKKRSTLERKGVFAIRTNVYYSFPRSVEELELGPTPDSIISKLSDFETCEWVKFFEENCAHIPHAASIDAQRVVADRWATCEKLRLARIPIPETRLIGSCVTDKFPVILKTQVACGPSASHLMMIARSQADVTAYRDSFEIKSLNTSVIAQSFIEHENFFKVFVIGKRVFVYQRTVERMKLGEIGRPSVTSSADVVSDPPVLSRLTILAKTISSAFQFDLFGFDVIESSHNDLYVVDVNFFPTYNELGGAQFRHLLDEYCRSLVSYSN